MKLIHRPLLFFLLLLTQLLASGQGITFNRILPPVGKTFGHVTGIVQDKQGYMWFATKNGLFRYDGYQMISYKNVPFDPNSLATDALEAICVDSAGVIWIGTVGYGLERFDPSTGIFKHYRYNPGQPGSISDDRVFAVTTDHRGVLWIGTFKGLNKYDFKTNTFLHFFHADDSSSLSSDIVRAIYEDRQGTLWIGTGSPYADERGGDPNDGGLNKLNRETGKFIRYKHDPNNLQSLINNKVRALFEDSKGNFWVGTAGDGLHKMNRASGTFQRFNYDPDHPEKLSRPPINKAFAENDHITFIKEDGGGGLWIGTAESGINYYNPKIRKTTHYESARDSTGAFTERTAWWAHTSREGVIWISTMNGQVYRVNAVQKTIPLYPIPNQGVNAFYEEPNGTLWMGTERGLVEKNPDDRLRELLHDPQNPNSLSSNSVQAILPNEEGNIWIGTVGGGLQFFDKTQEKFTTYRHDAKNSNSLGNDNIISFYEDPDKNLWIGTFKGLDRLDLKTKKFTHYLFYPEDTLSFGSNVVTSVIKDKQGKWWVTFWMKGGLQLFHPQKGKLKTYLKGNSIIKIYQDAKGELWAAGDEGLFKYHNTSDSFYQFVNPITDQKYNAIRSFMEDDQQNLWLSTIDGIIKIDQRRNQSVLYGRNYGINELNLSYGGCYKGRKGRLYFSDKRGYYSFFPTELFKDVKPPEILFSNFYLANTLIQPGTKGLLPEALSETKKIRLRYDQNVFSFDFAAIDYTNPEENRHFFMLDNYDNDWRESGLDHKASYYNVPPGKYTFRVKAFNGNGSWGEKILDIIITPPWWRTLWAYISFSIVFIALLWSIIYYRSRSLVKEKQRLEKKVAERTAEVVKQKEEIAIQRDNLKQTLQDLQSTQAQLVQREKMASLGELTAGIAHEIQNPLNFVNNFSEVNKELLEELKGEADKGNIKQVKSIADDLIDNQEKINRHGKRADAIVKGMLQHSRISTGQKEPTDINALADEYLRLSYHGLRAKDKTFNATIQTDFDNSIGKINSVPQDIGRVLLNLYNNAFYAVIEKKNASTGSAGQQYEPTVSVSTKKLDNKIEIKVSDNGNGIPQNIVDKIFQPFFTTKPTGQGTGLGLSLSYDIIKAHGGEIKVESKQDEGSEFIITLLLN